MGAIATNRMTLGIAAISLLATSLVAGCAPTIWPPGARVLPPSADGQQRVEVTELPPGTPKLTNRVKADTWLIEFGVPDGWKLVGEYNDKQAPNRILLTRETQKPNSTSKSEHELLVHCWKDTTDPAALRAKTLPTIKGAPPQKPVSEQTGPLRIEILSESPPTPNGPVFVVPGAGTPAEVQTLHASHVGGFTILTAAGAVSGKYSVRFHRTIYVIVKPAPKPGGCNYGITLREYSDGDGFEEKFMGDALAIAASLK